MYQNVADTAVSAEDAAASIVSQIRAFGKDASFATEVIDAYNEVANNFSVGTNDLASAMEVASSGLATYGNSFQQTIGLVTAGTEIMQGRSLQVARGLNMIASRIVKNQSALAAYGITVQNADGSLKSTYDVLTELAPQWEAMSDAQRVALGDSIAGTNQYKVLAAVMSNINTAVKANETAISSEGSAMKENARYMESFEAKLSQIDSKLQSFSNDVVNSDFAKFLMDRISDILSLADTGLGQVITQITLLTSLGWGATSLLKAMKIVSAAKKQFETFGAVISLVREGSGTLTEAISAAGGAASVALPAIAAITAAIVVLGKVIPAVANAIEEAIHAASYEGKVEAFENAIEEADRLQNKYEQAKNRLQDLNAVPWENRTPEIQAEIDRLNNLIEIYKMMADQANEEKIKAAQELLETAQNKGVTIGVQAVYTGSSTAPAFKEIAENEQVAEKLNTTYLNTRDAITQVATAVGSIVPSIKDLTQQWLDAEEGSKEQEDALSELKDALLRYNIAIKETKLTTSEFYDEFAKLREGVGGKGSDWEHARFTTLAEAFKEQYDAYKTLKQEGKDVDATVEKTAKEFEMMAAVDYRVRHSAESTAQQIHGLAEAYGMTEERAGALIRMSEGLAKAFTHVDQASQDMSFVNAQIGLAEYVDMVDKAINAKARFDEAIASGGFNYSSGYEGFADVYSEMQGLLEGGQIGGEFRVGAQLLFDESTYQKFIDALENNVPEAVRIAQEAMGKLSPLFGDAKNSGLGFVFTMQQLAEKGKLVGATYKDVDGQTEITITNLKELAESLHTSESGVFAAIQAWKNYGINAKLTSDELIGYLNDIGVATENNNIDMNSVVEKMRELGATDQDIMSLQSLLQNMSDVTLQNPVKSIEDLKDEAGNADDAADDVYDTLQGIKSTTFSQVRTQLSLLGTSLDTVKTKANNAASAVGSVDRAAGGNRDRTGNGGREPEGNAKGTRSARGGLTLVNEEGPEIIQENGKQRIANNGLPTLTNIKKGAVVYNAKDTAKMTMQKAGISGSATVSSSYLNTLFNNYGLSSSSSSSSTSSGASGYSASHTSSGYSGSSSSTSEDAWKKEFEEWLKWKDHQLAMDQITEQAYYDELNKMNEKYFANRAEYLEDYWKYQEQIYKWQKDKEKDLLNRQLDDLKELEDAINEKYDAQISALEDENKELDDQLKYEELLENLAKAKAERVLVYKDGRFQYVSGGQSVYDAQAALDAYNRDKALEEQKEEIEKLRENELSAILEQEEKINKQLEDLSDNKGYASGSFGVRGGLSLVGENGPELRVLNRGDGIVPADATANIMRWAGQTPRSFKSGILNELRNNVGGVVQHFENITLPNVTDIMSFMNEMKRLSRYVYQM